jgi:hypothetical protein
MKLRPFWILRRGESYIMWTLDLAAFMQLKIAHISALLLFVAV